MDLRVLQGGWHRHLRHFRALRHRLARRQDPKVFCLSCSDSRVNAHEIFDLNEPGSMFEVKNVGGLFTDDARAALVYALSHLNPDYLIVLHHSGCGGYATLGADVETEIRRHMVEYGGFRAKVIVDAYLKDNDIQLGGAEAERLLVEEGCRMQVHAMISFLSIQYPRLYEGIRQEKIKLLPLVYDTVSGRVFKVPERLEGSHSSKRHEL